MNGDAWDKKARNHCDNLIGKGEFPKQGSNSQRIFILDSREVVYS